MYGLENMIESTVIENLILHFFLPSDPNNYLSIPMFTDLDDDELPTPTSWPTQIAMKFYCDPKSNIASIFVSLSS